MQPLDAWLVGFGLRSLALVCGELFCFLYAVPTLFNLHSDLADAGAAILAIAALAGGFVGIVVLTREATALIKDKDQ